MTRLAHDLAARLGAVAALGLAACSIENTAFHASIDAGSDGPVGIVDDDTQAIVLSKTSLTVAEGASATFGVSLKVDPGSSATVTLMSNSAALPIDTAMVTFSGGAAGSWRSPVAVKVSPPIDTNATAETAMIT
ncbi:MAG TPA: hypothetical protein VK607_01580, partial [Kofleriaceae bacterium]|nr:hypothetical protein [Kofleriaceae bacterium]